MANIRLKELKIQNFKGIQGLEVDFSDRTVVSGRNATGKTSLMDAFFWLLFGKDSQGRSDFQIRQVDENGKMIDNTEISVTAVLDIDGASVSLTKTQKQKWVKKRGTDAPTFSGNENTYMVDGFPCSQKDFDAKVAAIIEEQLFRLLTNPMAFAQMKWQDQRAILLRFVPDITDADILSDYPETYARIADDIKAAGVDKTREKTAFALKKKREESKTFPTRIDEALRSVVDVDVEALTAARKEEADKLNDIRQKKTDLEASLKEVTEVQSKILDTKVRMTEIERTEREKAMQSRYTSQKAYEDARQEVRVLTDQYNRVKSALDIAESALSMNKEDLEETKAEWIAARDRKLPENATVCPTCQRPFEADKIAEVREKFEAAKESDKAVLNIRGKKLRKAIDDATANIDRMKAECEKLKAGISEKMAQVDALKAVYESAPTSVDVTLSVDYQNAQKQLTELQAVLLSMADGKARKQALDESEKGVLEAIRSIDSQLAVAEANKRAEERVAELREAQLACSQEVAEQERILCLIEDFMRRKMDRLSDAINANFKEVKFRLFDYQINGAVKETCVMQVKTNGSYVDYASANNGGRIVGGLDVINALSRLYGVSAPVLIDNSECVNDFNLPEMTAQTILLKVTDDSELVIEHIE